MHDNVKISACILCLREASKSLQGVDDDLSDSIMMIAAALAKRIPDEDQTVNELESIKDELDRS